MERRGGLRLRSQSRRRSVSDQCLKLAAAVAGSSSARGPGVKCPPFRYLRAKLRGLLEQEVLAADSSSLVRLLRTLNPAFVVSVDVGAVTGRLEGPGDCLKLCQASGQFAEGFLKWVCEGEEEGREEESAATSRPTLVDHIVSVGDQRSSAELLESAVVFVSRLVTLGFGEPPSHLGSSDFFRNNSSIKCGQDSARARKLLDKVLSQQAWRISEARGSGRNVLESQESIFGLMNARSTLDRRTLCNFYNWALRRLCSPSHDKDPTDMFGCLTAQVDWRLRGQSDGSSVKNLAELVLVDLLVPFSDKEVAKVVASILEERFSAIAGDGAAVSSPWKNLLLLISVATTCLDSFQEHLQMFLAEVLSTCLEGAVVAKAEGTSGLAKADQDYQKFVASLLVARQAGFEEALHQRPSSGPSSSTFVSYASWFGQTFGGGGGGGGGPGFPAMSQKKILRGIKYLTEVMPHEAAPALRAHLSKPPALAQEHKHLWQDYCNLARTRLCDLSSSGAIVKSHALAAECGASDDGNAQRRNGLLDLTEVAKVVKQYKESGTADNKIPHAVSEASIFKRHYFVNQFLPSLARLRKIAAERDLGDRESWMPSADVVDSFVSALKAKKMIPASILASSFE